MEISPGEQLGRLWNRLFCSKSRLLRRGYIYPQEVFFHHHYGLRSPRHPRRVHLMLNLQGIAVFSYRCSTSL